MADVHVEGTPHSRTRGGSVSLPVPAQAVLFVVLFFAGAVSILSTISALGAIWMEDPLKSIGMLMPFVSIALILRCWKSLDWETQGTWWGLGLIAATVLVVHLRERMYFELVLTGTWAIFLPPHQLVVLSYLTGFVLLFGGTRLLRASVFPVLLILAVNPVPKRIVLAFDLPLQHASALVARSFAHALGQKLTPDQLRLMFTPDFGMFIAPGCDGIRGAITMAYIALIAAYLYRMRWRNATILVVGAVALGYVFNVVRLCVLVIYYVIGLHITWLQPHAEMGDYLIGASLFFVATGLLFAAIRRFGATNSMKVPPLPSQPQPKASRTAPALRWRVACLLVLFLFGSVKYARARMLRDQLAAEPMQWKTFPETVGPYQRRREWKETLITGYPLYYWAEYAKPGDTAVVSIGASPTLGSHDALICHAVRGEDWIWNGNVELPTANGNVAFSGSFFDTGATLYLEANTLCLQGHCGQATEARRHFGFAFTRPSAAALVSQDPHRAVPLIVHAETTDTAMNVVKARAMLTAEMSDFLQYASLADFTTPRP